jgi:predicted hotdog family 3-hydroxylacyl-ACP dehydratase
VIGSILPPLQRLVPHEGDAVLLDAVVQVNDGGVTARLCVRPGTSFSNPDGALPGWVGAEIMAQAIAAFAGYESFRDRGEPAELGLLLGIRGYSSKVDCYLPGQSLQVEATPSSRDDDGTGVFDCKIKQNEDILARGTLTVWLPRNADELLMIGGRE